MAEIGNLYVIAAPSGAGKTTLVKALTGSLPGITVSISHTTRTKRPNEIENCNYYFIAKSEFEYMIKQKDFLEYAIVFDHYYGTSKRWVQETLTKGIDVILEIDWQGHQQVKNLFPHSFSIFILPPSIESLRERLYKRNEDHLDIITKRLQDTAITVSHVNEFDYLVINDDFLQALQDLQTIVLAGRLARKRQVLKFADLIHQLAVTPT